MMANQRYNKICTLVDILGNVTLLIIGMCLLGLGMAEKSTPVSVLFSAESKIGTIATVIGFVLIVSSVLNCCFAMSEVPLLGHLYTGILLALFILSIAITIIYGTHPESYMKGDVRIRMRDLLHFKTHDPNRTDFDSIQQMFKCCGIDSYKDWYYLTTTKRIPQSCCQELGCDTTDPSSIYQKACLELLMDSTSSLLNKIVGTLIALMVCLPIQILIVSSLMMNFF